MERQEAYQRLNAIIGHDLRAIADQHGVTVYTPQGKLNKGWAGHAIERHLGLAQNSSRAPNFGSWELKVIPLKRTKAGGYWPKETMAITMFDPVEVAQKAFAESHLYNKLKKALIVARTVEDDTQTHSYLHAITAFDLSDPQVYEAIKTDYDTLCGILLADGFDALSGKDGRVIQARTKGAGHGSTSRAFYARKHFLAYLLGLSASMVKDTP